MKIKQPIRVFEAFAGYGGASFGLRRCGYPFEVIGMSEIDPSACRILDVNFPEIRNYGNIRTIREHLERNKRYIPAFDMFTGGFPCQPFSSAGLQLGEDDELERGTLIYEILTICEIKKPKYIFLENVKGFNAQKFAKTKNAIIERLHRLGYEVKMQLLNTKDYGIPQNRERLWIFAYKGKLPANFNMIPQPVIPDEQRPRLAAFLDPTPPPEVYLTPQQIAHFMGVHTSHGFTQWVVNEPLCFDVYNHKMKTNGITNTLTEPSHNITRIVEPPQNGHIRIRKLSIDEQFRLMGFRDGEIIFPDDINYTQISARAGNGWDVHLVGLLLKHIFDQL